MDDVTAAEASFDVVPFLEERRDAVLDRAGAEVARRHLPHYEEAGAGAVASRLADLYDAVVASASARNLDAALAHAHEIATARQQTGHDLSEVQRAINAMEEQLWLTIVEDVPAHAQGHVLGVVSTILGAVKDRLACDYLAAATPSRPKTLRIDELFKGTSAGLM